MKEIRYNLMLLINKKEVYFFILGVMVVNAVHVFMVINRYVPEAIIQTGEYQSILYNSDVSLMSILILAFPVLIALAFGDMSWNELHIDYYVSLYPRINMKRNIWIRLFIIIVSTFIVCFLGFMLNYITLCFIAGSGNLIINDQSLPFYLTCSPDCFLDTVRFSNPVLFTLLINGHVSLLFALLAGLSYAFSFFSKQKLAIYFQVLLYMIIIEVVFSFLGLGSLSIIRQLQPASIFSIFNSIFLYIALFIITVGLLWCAARRRDLL